MPIEDNKPMRVVDFPAILRYAGQFPEMKMLSRASLDLSRIDGHGGQSTRFVDDFMGLRPGIGFGNGWAIDRISFREDEVDVACTGPDSAAVTFFVGRGNGGPACPFDRAGFRIGYHPDDLEFDEVAAIGPSFAEMVTDTLQITDDDWNRALATASSTGGADGLSAEALRMVEMRPDGKVYIRMTGACQERCLFCFYYGTPQEIGEPDNPDAAIEQIIDGLDPATTTQIILTGGEPTLVPDFERHLQRLVDRGFREIVVQTNGIATARRGFLDRFAQFNKRISFGFSLHAATMETSNAVTGVTSHGNFQAKTASIRKAVSLGYVTKITCVVTTLNLPELEDIVRFCASTGMDGQVPDNVILQFSMPVIRGLMAGSKHACPALAQVRRAVEPALDLADRLGLKSSLSSMCSVPPCCLPDHLQHLESMWYREGPTEWWESERAFGPQCRECVLKSWCSGVSPLYLEWFGAGDLKPFDRAHTSVVMPTDNGGPE